MTKRWFGGGFVKVRAVIAKTIVGLLELILRGAPHLF